MVRVIGLSLICAISLNAQIFIFGDTLVSPTIDKAPIHTFEIGNLVFTSSSSNKGAIKSLTNDHSVALMTLLPKSRYAMRPETGLSKPLTKIKAATIQVSKTVHKVPSSPQSNHPKPTDMSKYLVH